MFDEPAVFDFDELADHLVEQGLQSSPSEIHGCLCGLLAAGANAQPELALAALVQTLDLELRGEMAERVMQLYTVSAQALEDEEFAFHPLLPDDEADIGERVAALALWCKGFMVGFAQVAASAEKSSENVLSRDSAEILKDFTAIAEAQADDEDCEDENAAEESYFELVEYLRFATLNVYLDSQAGGAQDSTRDSKRSLH